MTIVRLGDSWGVKLVLSRTSQDNPLAAFSNPEESRMSTGEKEPDRESPCDSCGKYRPSDELIYDDPTDQHMCEECYNRVIENEE